ncbi:hypothetical protein K2173_025778 [Erythroxylum novogranatense]|uniref:Pentatricopeptide repeat-containing protein n=1 Tax=Erythroxylum novogranatense TaxID=1862640 RepID=A0AAV8SI05_9ROSI|nr:hypothetical protein K2173_025778 [Erythroxylum novogranatense]
MTFARLVGRRLYSSHRYPHCVPPIPTYLPPGQSASLSPNYSEDNFFTLCNLLRDPVSRAGPSLEYALDRTGIELEPSLLQAVFDHFDSSPKLLHTLFLWAQKKPGFSIPPSLFNGMLNLLGKAREFDSAWLLLLDRINGGKGPELVSSDTFATLLRRYSRAGMTQAAIRTLEYACNLPWIRDSDAAKSLFEILLDSLCKEGHASLANDYLNKQREFNLQWVLAVRVYNIMLNGWLRSRNLKQAERLWLQMKKENVKPSIVTYGTMIEGYCRMRHVESAINLVDDMIKEGVEPNSIVYNPIIDALAEAGRFKEVSKMMERILLCESGPTLSTYNSLVKGYCKAGDLAGASDILKVMISRGFVPTTTTYNYFFRHYSKFGKIEEGMNLYTRMIESGYIPDRLTYHLLLKMLCEEEMLNLAAQVSKEMRSRGCDMDLASSTMLVHLLCKMHRFEEAFEEFVDMLRRGIVPQYLTFRRLNDELQKHRMIKMAHKLSDMMSLVSHSKNLPNTYNVEGETSQHERREAILQKAEAISEVLKTCNNPRKLVKMRTASVNPLSSANQLMEIIRKRANEIINCHDVK